MKVLFALGSEQLSKRVADKYLERYSEEIEYKNVFYFKALLEEVKKDKTYDRIVVSEDLEQFQYKNVEALDKFLFNNIDSITDEIEDSEIIFICSDRRSKDHDKFVERLFNIGVYNTLIGDERDISSLCERIRKPMNKKEAKQHLNINPLVSDGAMATRDDEVEEVQIMSILKYYDNIRGKKEEYLPAFDRIAEQYSRNQLKVILTFLPPDVKQEVLSSEKYAAYLGAPEETDAHAKNASKGNPVIKQPKRGLFGILKENKIKEMHKKQPTVSVEQTEENHAKEQAELKAKAEQEAREREQAELKAKAEQEAREREQAELQAKAEQEAREREQAELKAKAEQEAREREQAELKAKAEQEAREREQTELQAKAEQEAREREQAELKAKAEQEAREREQAELKAKAEQEAREREQAELQEKAKQEELEKERMKIEAEKAALEEAKKKLAEQSQIMAQTALVPEGGPAIDLKKMVVFVGANKSGTTFISNAVAHHISSDNTSVGLFDATKDKSLYYIYNQDDKTLRNIAAECMQRLGEGEDAYLPGAKHLKVYTSVPSLSSETKRTFRNKTVIETVKNANALVVVDADFSTPYEYFEKADEIYIVQDMDIIRMQETTMFLRDLKNRGIPTQKIRIVINKFVKCLLTPKKIIEGLSYYNDPQMSFIDELLDSKVKSYIIPLQLENYARYVDGVYKNEINFKKFTLDFIQAITALGEDVYRKAPKAGRKKGIFG